MNTLTKYPVRVARQALAVGAQRLRAYSHKNRPNKFTRPQLFSCPALKSFFKTESRGLEQLLADLPELSDTLWLGLGQNNAHLLITWRMPTRDITRNRTCATGAHMVKNYRHQGIRVSLRLTSAIYIV